MSNFYKDAKTVATGWATITSAGKSTVVSDSMKTANIKNMTKVIFTYKLFRRFSTDSTNIFKNSSPRR